MALFTSDKTRDAETGFKILSLAARRFNDIPGSAFSVHIDINKDAIVEACDVFNQIVDAGFPENSGPFKRLAGVAVLLQHLRILDVSRVQGSGLPDVAKNDFCIEWAPRFAVVAIEFMAPLIKLSTGRSVESFHLPTPHYQVEFIGMLRGYCRGSFAIPELCVPLLLERCTSTGLALEAAAYCGEDIHPWADGGADDCVSEIVKDPELRADLEFNNPEFLNLAVGMGLEG